MQYLTYNCSRFQAETLISHAPVGTFLIRSPHPFSPFFILSYGEEKKVVVCDNPEKEKKRFVVTHRILEKTEIGYVSGTTYASLDAVLNEMKDVLHYGLRLDKEHNVVSCESMPWFNDRRVKEVRGGPSEEG